MPEQYRIVMFLDKGRSGLSHKLEDFYSAAELAVKTDRALVDFSPAIRADHMRNKYNEMVVTNATPSVRYFHGWSWKNLLTTSKVLYQLHFINVS